MKAVLFKYGADPCSDQLYDSKSDHCDLRDPDFEANDQPIWSICGPYVRKNLQKDDILFFMPQLNSLKSAGLPPAYICTGVLVVSDTIKEGGKHLRDPRISEAYRRQYVWSYNKHINGQNGRPGDKRRAPRTANIRGFNIILGGSKSKWLGREGPRMDAVCRKAGLPVHKLRYHRIPYVNDEETVRKLYKLVVGNSLS